MKEIASYAEIEYRKNLPTPLAFRSFIWQFSLKKARVIELEFIRNINRDDFGFICNVIINREEYKECDTLEELGAAHAAKGWWFNGGDIIYIRFPDRKDPFTFYSRLCGILKGFTNGKPRLADGVMYRPGLLTTPVLEQNADVFTYDKMKFNNASVSLDNTNGQFDDVNNLFGNDFNIFVDEIEDNERTENIVRLSDDMLYDQLIAAGTDINKLVVLGTKNNETINKRGYQRYYIANIIVGLENANFQLKDKRERFSAKIPEEIFNANEYPSIDDKLIDKDKQEAYGYCLGIPGICTHGKETLDKFGKVINQYHFRFSSQISRVDRIQVKMNDIWTTVYQGERPEPNSPDDWPGNYPLWNPEVAKGNAVDYLDIGEITLDYSVAKKGGERKNEANEIRMDGVFNNPEKRKIEINEAVMPLDIIKDIIIKHTDILYKNMYFDIAELESELGVLNHKIGILFDKQQTVYEAIEKLQSGSVKGFQFQIHKDKFTARLDDPERMPDKNLGAIRSHDILSLDEVEVDWNANLYGTHTDIGYAYNYSEGSGRRFVDTDRRQAILDIHQVEKVWEADSLLYDIEDAKLKSDILLEDFIELRPIISNIKLFGTKWFDLRVYDMVLIDFRKIEKLRNRTIARDFAGKQLCQILRISSDANTGITTIDVRVRKEVGDE